MHFGDKSPPSLESQNLTIYADEMLKLINRNEIEIEIKTNMDDVELFTFCLLVCYYYNFSPEIMWEDKAEFPYFVL